MNVLDTARTVVAEGGHPIPLNGKLPAIRRYWEFEPDPASLGFWFAQRQCNLGLLLPGLVVVDTDSADGEQWFQEHIGQESPMVVKTVRGLHRYYRRRARDDLHKIQLPSVDILTGERVFSVLPPSQHPSGAFYQWVSRVPFSELPEINTELFCDSRQSTKIVEHGATTLFSTKRECVKRYIAKIFAISGQRGHNSAFRAACKLRDAGLTEEEALEDLWAWNETNALPPFSWKEIEHKVKSAYERRS